MSGATLAYLGIALLALVLPIAALRGQRLPIAGWFRWGMVWVVLFVVATLAFAGLRA